jgi:hypothetical protein
MGPARDPGEGGSVVTAGRHLPCDMSPAAAVTPSSARLSRRICALAFPCVVTAAFAAGAHASPETNIARAAAVTSRPYVGAAIDYLVDGRTGDDGEGTLMLSAPLPIRGDRPLNVEYTFDFGRAVQLSGIRLYQLAGTGRQPAAAYVVDADVDGSGRYARRIAAESRASTGTWIVHRVEPTIAAHAVRLRTTRLAAVSGPQPGSPVIGEFEILSPTAIASTERPPLPPAPRLRMGNSLVAEPDVDVPEDRTFKRGLFGSMWLFWQPGQRYDPRQATRRLDTLDRLHANRYWLYAGVPVANDRLPSQLTLPADSDYRFYIDRQRYAAGASGSTRVYPFPSSVVAGYRENVLGELVADMHRRGTRVIVNESLLPFGIEGWDFPRVDNPRVYPSVLGSAFVRTGSSTFYRELMGAGADGVAVGGDEFFHRTSPVGEDAVATACRDQAGRLRDVCRSTMRTDYETRFGSLPPAPSRRFSPDVARWKAFEYERLADLFTSAVKTIKAARSDALVTTLLRAGSENRPAFGVALDVLGTTAGIDEMGSNPYWSHDSHLGHYYFASEVKKLAGASPSRTAIVTLQATPRFDRHGYRNPLMLYGPALSALMHGARGVNFYKHDYLYAAGSPDAGAWVERFFRLTLRLERKGLLDFRVPRSVAVVYSRASEDWWQLAHADGDGVEAQRATLTQGAVLEALFRAGIPFDLHYLDQPDRLHALRDYDVVVLPFPYAMSEAALRPIVAAARNGATVVAFAQHGDVDAFAARHPRPLLEGLAGVHHVALDIDRLRYEDLARTVTNPIIAALGARRPLTLATGGADVECAILEHERRRLAFCLNWGTSAAAVNVGIGVPPGEYTASLLDWEHETVAVVDDRARLTEKDLSSFRILLPGGAPWVLAIDPAASSGGEDAVSGRRG